MNQFVFEKRQKSVLIGAMILGALCLFGSLIGDDELHTRFWSNYLHNTVFFTGIAFISLFILTAFTTAWAGWHTNVKRVWEAFSLFMTPGAILMLVLVVGVFFGFNHLYHWADAEAVAEDPILLGKSSFLNPIMYAFFTILVMGTFIFFARKIRAISLEEDEHGANGLENNFKHHRKLRVWSAAFLPFAGFFSAAAIWQWIMSLDAHWYSTLFAWYTAASWFVAAMALTIMLLIYLKGKGYLDQVNADHFHDIGKYMFGISIFWTYLWFSQFMLIWYANVGEETVYFYDRMNDYPVLFYANLVLNFVLPFFILMRNDNKRKYGTMFTASLFVFFGHWLDFFLMIKPGARHTAMEHIAHHSEHAGDAAHDTGEHALEFMAGFTLPGLLEIGIMIGFLAFFLYFVFMQLAKAPLTPKNDPYMDEAEHHSVWPYVD